MVSDSITEFDHCGAVSLCIDQRDLCQVIIGNAEAHRREDAEEDWEILLWDESIPACMGRNGPHTESHLLRASASPR